MPQQRKHLTYEILQMQNSIRKKYKDFKRMVDQLQISLEKQYTPLVEGLSPLKTEHHVKKENLIKNEFIDKKTNITDEETDDDNVEMDKKILIKPQQRVYGTPQRSIRNYGSMGTTRTPDRLIY